MLLVLEVEGMMLVIEKYQSKFFSFSFGGDVHSSGRLATLSVSMHMTPLVRFEVDGN